MVHLISNRGGSHGGFNSVVLSAALADGQLRAKQYAAAAKIEATARALAAAHHETGMLESSITTRHIPGNRSDLEVVATDPDIWHIEFGHEAPDGSWVSGLHIMRDAALLNGGIVSFPGKGGGETGVPA